MDHTLDHITALVTVILPAVLAIITAITTAAIKILAAVKDMRTQVNNQGDRAVNAVKGVQQTVMAVHEVVNGQAELKNIQSRQEGYAEGLQTGQQLAATPTKVEVHLTPTPPGT